tara:strand:- start:1280 stop:1918 length:639 start_codon:yes stop_codon:yes gene_type:complete
MEKIKNYSILVLAIALGVLSYIHFQPVEDVVVITDEKTGGVEEKIDDVVRDTIYIETIVPGQAQPQRKEIVVDSTYKADYEKAIKDNDSLKAKNLFLESISLNTWNGNLIDNKDIKIDGKFLTRGKLLEYKVDYKIKSDTLTFKPTIKYQHPRLTLLPGIKLGLPTDPLNNTEPVIELNVGIQNKKGNIFSVGIDSQKRFTVGYNIALKIFK